MTDDTLAAYMMGQDSSNNGGGMFGGDGWWAIILFAMIFGWGGGGYGGFGGGVGFNGALTRAELYDGFAIQNIDSAVRGVQQGICDSTYAITGNLTNGFHGVDNAICNLGYQTQSGFNALGTQLASCCCETQRLIERGFCDVGNHINTQTRDIIDNANANAQRLMDFLVGEKMASKDARIAELTNQLSQSNQNAVLRAAIDASTAEIIRRTGNECPVPAYVVPNPNCCYGNPVGVGYAYGNGYSRDGGCGCGC
jgi:hypothetical protein